VYSLSSHPERLSRGSHAKGIGHTVGSALGQGMAGRIVSDRSAVGCDDHGGRAHSQELPSLPGDRRFPDRSARAIVSWLLIDLPSSLASVVMARDALDAFGQQIPRR